MTLLLTDVRHLETSRAEAPTKLVGGRLREGSAMARTVMPVPGPRVMGSWTCSCLALGSFHGSAGDSERV